MTPSEIIRGNISIFIYALRHAVCLLSSAGSQEWIFFFCQYSLYEMIVSGSSSPLRLFQKNGSWPQLYLVFPLNARALISSLFLPFGWSFHDLGKRNRLISSPYLYSRRFSVQWSSNCHCPHLCHCETEETILRASGCECMCSRDWARKSTCLRLISVKSSHWWNLRRFKQMKI